jgi:hypothetical protein
MNEHILIGLDPDMSPDELEEKARLITQVLELQNTLDGKFVFMIFNILLIHICMFYVEQINAIKN